MLSTFTLIDYNAVLLNGVRGIECVSNRSIDLDNEMFHDCKKAYICMSSCQRSIADRPDSEWHYPI